MKRNKFLPFIIFFGIMCIGILSQKFIGLRGRGNLLPEEPINWIEIIQRLPITTIVSVIFTYIFVQLFKENKKMNEKNLENNRKRNEEIEKYYSAPNIHECRVCGCYSVDFPWGEDGRNPSYNICQCCGVQFGKEDISLESIKKYRTEWLIKGGKWFAKDERPENCNLETQMKNIPNEFR